MSRDEDEAGDGSLTAPAEGASADPAAAVADLPPDPHGGSDALRYVGEPPASDEISTGAGDAGDAAPDDAPAVARSRPRVSGADAPPNDALFEPTPDGVVLVDMRRDRRRLFVLGAVVAPDLVLTVAQPDFVDAETVWRIREGLEHRPATQILTGGPSTTPWVLLRCAVDTPSLPLSVSARPGRPCVAWRRAGPTVERVDGRLAWQAGLNPSRMPLSVRPHAAQRLPDLTRGAPCIVNGSIVGVMLGTRVPGRPHLLATSPIDAIADQCAQLELADSLVVHRGAEHDPETPVDPWPRHPPPMVGWYDPLPLIRTTVNMLISDMFERFDDVRVNGGRARSPAIPALEAIDAGDAPFWIDYVADTGDGFNPTYAVASAIALPALPLQRPDGEWEITHRGHLLVFGGDQVYPIASPREYARRFEAPFALAATGETPSPDDPRHPWSQLPEGLVDLDLIDALPIRPYSPNRDFRAVGGATVPPRLPWVLSLPGNHDWYDNLTHFTRLFCAGERFAEWSSVQQRSYFAQRLPYGWWIFGLDVGLGGDINKEQALYFLDCVDAMGADDKAILFAPEPWWVDGTDGMPRKQRPYVRMVEQALSEHGQLKLWLAGDLHHYRRHEAIDGTQKITAGGGGAFLHATHPAEPVATLPARAAGDDGPQRPGEYCLRQSFPEPAESRRLALRNLLFPFMNWKFAVLLGLAYLFGAWLLVPETGVTRAGGELHRLPLAQLPRAIGIMLEHGLMSPISGLYLIGLMMAIRGLSNTSRAAYNWIAGLIHGALHVLFLLATTWLIARLTVHGLAIEKRSIWQLLVGAPIIFLVGAIPGSGLIGLYLWISSRYFGLHMNEAFSSLRCADWKNFVRLRITPDSLTIYPVGLRRVPRHWYARESRGGPHRWPSAKQALRPRLIEAPIVIRADDLRATAASEPPA